MGAGNTEFGRYNPFFLVQLLNWSLQFAMMKMIQNRYFELNSLIPIIRAVKESSAKRIKVDSGKRTEAKECRMKTFYF